ncbi:MAG: YbaB/EbfC family nucleoid-associated protein [Dehalococcoidia bacterium]|nr:MAG: YbaB/EbfC family nucleoid-associated protein [Dehalococcoidia bacterium]
MDKRLLRQAQQLQAKLAKAQEELGDITAEATSGGGAVKVVIDGRQKVHSVEISPEVINVEDAELLQDLVMTAMNEAIAKSQELASKHLGKVTGGLSIPGLT